MSKKKTNEHLVTYPRVPVSDKCKGKANVTCAVITDFFASVEYFFRGDLQQDTHLPRPPVGILLVSKVALNELLELQIGPFFGDFNHVAANTDGTLPMSRVNDSDHDPWVAPDIAKLLMAFNGID